MSTEDGPHRAYEVLSQIGKGGFGEVYHARMRGPQGYIQDVALKIAREAPSPSALARFRDEARILSLVHDRAIVSALPPVRLDGRWTMVMEYVDGASVAQVVRRRVFSPQAALQLVAEVARALHRAHFTPGPDGKPLELIHRDLKPGNLMLTAAGQVKLLDFGIARAAFDEREAETVATFVGTPGYIAPERLRGVEGPAADVYSLGVLLHVLVTGRTATKISDDDARGAPLDVVDVLRYASGLRADHPHQRPTAEQVERECRAWAGKLEGPNLVSIAAWAVPKMRTREKGELAGTVLYQDVSSEARRAKRGTRWWLVVLGLAVTLLFFALAMSLGFVVSVAQRQAPVEGLVPIAIEPAGPPLPPRPRASEPPTAAPPVAKPPPRPRKPAPARRDLVTANFLSDPPGAEIRIDGVPIGHTPLRNHPISTGDHALSFHRADDEATQTVRVGGRHGFREFVWTTEGIIAQ